MSLDARGNEYPDTLPAPSRPNPINVLTRIRRTFSAKTYFTSKSSKSPQATSLPSTPTVSDECSYSVTPVALDEPGTISRKGHGSTPFEKFVKSLKRKNGKASSEFPPSHWELIEERKAATEALDQVLDTPLPIDTCVEPEANVPDVSESDTPTDDMQTTPEPVTLAYRIQTILSSFPQFLTPSSTPAEQSTSTPTSTVESSRIPLPLFITDSKLVSLLSSSSIMNGSSDSIRPSVWSILDHLKAKLPNGSPNSPDEQTLPEQSYINTGEGDSSSVMLYAPLVPDDSSEIEVAKTEVVPEPEPTPGQEGKGAPLLSPSSPQGENKSISKRVWIPSSTKLSLQINWWGYRLYLPPPVLAVLDNKRLESAKRAALITTSLKWALDHIPVPMIPLQMHPVLSVLKNLVPYLGYVGGFIAWSWGAIKTFDKGNGVVLTATWLLPVALIPGTWEDDDYPEVIEQRRRTEEEASSSTTSQLS